MSPAGWPGTHRGFRGEIRSCRQPPILPLSESGGVFTKPIGHCYNVTPGPVHVRTGMRLAKVGTGFRGDEWGWCLVMGEYV